MNTLAIIAVLVHVFGAGYIAGVWSYYFSVKARREQLEDVDNV